MYEIKYSTGAGDFEVEGTLAEAMLTTGMVWGSAKKLTILRTS